MAPYPIGVGDRSEFYAYGDIFYILYLNQGRR
jgi:hypothetical protein